MILALSIAVGVVIAVALFRLFFEDAADFLECIRFYFTPDFISAIRGEWAEDWWASMKLGVWLAVSIGMGFVAHYKFEQFWGSGPDAETVAARAADVAMSDEPEEEDQAGTKPAIKPTLVVTNPPVATPAGPAQSYGVKVGDVVQISALNPAIALRRATIVSIDNDQVTVRSGVDDFTVQWKNVTKIKAAK
jgi:hypothetical protein